MNLGFYGHTNTIVFISASANGKFERHAICNGMKAIEQSVRSAMEATEFTMHFDIQHDNSDSNAFRRDYYEVCQYRIDKEKTYTGINRNLGYEEGTTPNNIFSSVPNVPGAIDLLFVWDAGYSDLVLPSSNHVFWASNQALPNKEVFDEIAKKCFLFLDGTILRDAGAMISKQISWERTAIDLISEIQNNPQLNYLLNARQLLISFGVDGAVFILPKNNQNEQFEACLTLTDGKIEGSIFNNYPHKINGVFSFSHMATSLISAIASPLLNPNFKVNFDEKPVDLFDSIGTILIDKLFPNDQNHIVGNKAIVWGTVFRLIQNVSKEAFFAPIYDTNGNINDESTPPGSTNVDLNSGLSFPIPLIEENPATRLVPDNWSTIGSLSKTLSDIQDKTIKEIEGLTLLQITGRTITDIAFEYIKKGAVAIEGLPQLSLGKLTTVDRREIEAYQNIRNLILDYAQSETTRPLSIAVFGSPGSGKSFGVTEIAENISDKIKKLEFNVSQFTSLSDLGVAFQKVRDTILVGKLPLVFFDEFDSDRDGNALGWLKTFLMPMQDGKFKDESGEHPLGRCILVFAGGTAATFDEFVSPSGENSTAQFKNVKGPDFVSRLRGTIDVLGPNPKDDDDKNFILRRALLLRGLCERRFTFDNNMAPVSDKIIRAMLHVPEFKHGARSMEAILDMSRIDGNSWEPVSLPSRSQLALHVDADAFIRLVLGE